MRGSNLINCKTARSETHSTINPTSATNCYTTGHIQECNRQPTVNVLDNCPNTRVENKELCDLDYVIIGKTKQSTRQQSLKMHSGQKGNYFREQQFKGVQREQLEEWLKQPRIQKLSEFKAKTLGESEQSRKVHEGATPQPPPNSIATPVT